MKIIKLSAIDSTNAYLRSLGREIAVPDTTVVVAKRQTAGRGQRLSTWHSVPGESLTFSIYKRFSALAVHKQFELLMATSLAVKEALEDFGIPQVSVKWPNDILSRSQKICGILIENTLTGNTIAMSIIGIGLNVNETSFPNLPQATSMKLAAGTSFDLDTVLWAVCKSVIEAVSDLEHSESSLKNRYEEALFGNLTEHTFEYPDGTRFMGTIRGVSSLGELVVETAAPELQKFQFKELRLLL